MALTDLINVTGRMDTSFRRLDQDTISSSDEINSFILGSDDTPNQYDHFWSSDIAVFVSGQPKLVYLARRALNPIFKEETIDRAFKEMSEKGVYRMQAEDVEKICSQAQIENGDAVVIDISQLWIDNPGERSLMTVFWPDDHKSYKNVLNMNPAKKTLFKFLYGRDDALSANLERISKKGMKRIHVWLLNPEAAKEIAPEGCGLAMPLLISGIGSDSHYKVYQSISAAHPEWHPINNETYCMRGMPRYEEVIRQVAECIKKGKPFDYQGHTFVPVPLKGEISSFRS